MDKYEFCCKMVILGFAPDYDTISKIVENVASYLNIKKADQE